MSDDKRTKFFGIWAPARPDKKVNCELIDEQGMVIARIGLDESMYAFPAILKDQIFESQSRRLTLVSSDPYSSKGTILVDPQKRRLRWQEYPEHRSVGWDEVVDRSKQFMSAVELCFTTVKSLTDVIHNLCLQRGIEFVPNNFAPLVVECNEKQNLVFRWAVSIFLGVDPEAEIALYEWPAWHLDDWLSTQPPKLRRWLKAIFNWCAGGNQSPLGGFDWLVYNVESDPEETVRRFAELPTYHVAALRLLVGVRSLSESYAVFLEGESEEIATTTSVGPTERRYRNVDVADCFHVNRQAITNWKNRAPDLFPKASRARASAWRAFIRAAWPCGKYDPSDIPLY